MASDLRPFEKLLLQLYFCEVRLYRTVQPPYKPTHVVSNGKRERNVSDTIVQSLSDNGFLMSEPLDADWSRVQLKISEKGTNRAMTLYAGRAK